MREAMSSAESAPVTPALWRANSTISARASARTIQGNRRRTGLSLELYGGRAPGLQAPVEIRHQALALGVGHLRPARDLGEAAAAPQADTRCGVERADTVAGAFDHGLAGWLPSLANIGTAARNATMGAVPNPTVKAVVIRRSRTSGAGATVPGLPPTGSCRRFRWTFSAQPPVSARAPTSPVRAAP